MYTVALEKVSCILQEPKVGTQTNLKHSLHNRARISACYMYKKCCLLETEGEHAAAPPYIHLWAIEVEMGQHRDAQIVLPHAYCMFRHSYAVLLPSYHYKMRGV